MQTLKKWKFSDYHMDLSLIKGLVINEALRGDVHRTVLVDETKRKYLCVRETIA